MNKTWDEYFLTVCNAVGENTKCLSRRIGAILVKDKSIISTGYNGPARGIPHCGLERYMRDPIVRDQLNDHENISDTCPRQLMGYKSGEGLDICIAGHAERNALINAARNGTITKDCTMYMNCNIPCSPCLIDIINAGIKEIVVTELVYYDTMGKYILTHSNLTWRIYE